MLWVDSLSFVKGSNCSSAATYASTLGVMQLVFLPGGPGGTLFSTSEVRNPMLREWVARGSTFTSLY